MVKLEGPQGKKKKRERNWRQEEPRCAPYSSPAWVRWEAPLSALSAGKQKPIEMGSDQKGPCILIGRRLDSLPQSKKGIGSPDLKDPDPRPRSHCFLPQLFFPSPQACGSSSSVKWDNRIHPATQN